MMGGLTTEQSLTISSDCWVVNPPISLPRVVKGKMNSLFGFCQQIHCLGFAKQ
jgi:hypothetical protein